VPLNTYNTRKQLEQNQLKNQQILLRCSQPLSNKQTPHPTTKMKRHHHRPTARTTRCCLRTQQCAWRNAVLDTKPTTICCCAPSRHPLQAHDSSRLEQDLMPHPFVVLLRKEVIQPHLPVRLPCYDFVPIADPTFDSSPHKG